MHGSISGLSSVPLTYMFILILILIDVIIALYTN